MKITIIGEITKELPVQKKVNEKRSCGLCKHYFTCRLKYSGVTALTCKVYEYFMPVCDSSLAVRRKACIVCKSWLSVAICKEGRLKAANKGNCPKWEFDNAKGETNVQM